MIVILIETWNQKALADREEKERVRVANVSFTIPLKAKICNDLPGSPCDIFSIPYHCVNFRAVRGPRTDEYVTNLDARVDEWD